ncbi:MAG: hypothetical protein J2P58_06985 [Acidimicrobiaceae bacterium]|nr:hypothetical protein [Acidimicrobiaceae bacterium]
MPRSSWSKKVARAAGTGGGRTNRGRVPWTYYGAIALVIVLGVVGTLVSKDRRANQINNQGTSAPAIGTVWNEAIAFYLCGSFAPNVPQSKNNGDGLTTQGDGIMHIAPTNDSAAGKNATLGKWASGNDVKLTAAQIQLPKGKLYSAGDSCEGGKGQVYVKQFAYPGDPTGVLVKGNPAAVHLQNQLELVVAFVPPSKSGKIPGPPKAIVSKLKALSAPASTTTTTTPSPAAASTTTTPGSATTTTPSPAAASTTTAPASGATTAPAGGSATTAPASGASTTAPSSAGGASPSTSK